MPFPLFDLLRVVDLEIIADQPTQPLGVGVGPECSTGRQRRSLFGQAEEYSRNQWPSLVRYLNDARFAIDNGEAERAIRPLAIGRGNWLHVGGDSGLKTASVLLSVCASATRHELNPWAYLADLLTQLADKPTDLSHLLPDAWALRSA